MTTSAKGEAANARPDEHKWPQAGTDDQPPHLNSDRSFSREEFMAKVAEQKARIKAMSPEELHAFLDMGDPANVKFPGNPRAMEILEELEGGSNSDGEEDEEASGSVNREGEKSRVTEDEQDGNEKTAPGTSHSQNGKKKVMKQKKESEDLLPSKS